MRLAATGLALVALVDKFLEAGRSYRILPPIVERPDAATPAVNTTPAAEPKG
jgi:hypothetical protein